MADRDSAASHVAYAIEYTHTHPHKMHECKVFPSLYLGEIAKSYIHCNSLTYARSNRDSPSACRPCERRLGTSPSWLDVAFYNTTFNRHCHCCCCFWLQNLRCCSCTSSARIYSRSMTRIFLLLFSFIFFCRLATKEDSPIKLRTKIRAEDKCYIVDECRQSE